MHRNSLNVLCKYASILLVKRKRLVLQIGQVAKCAKSAISRAPALAASSCPASEQISEFRAQKSIHYFHHHEWSTYRNLLIIITTYSVASNWCADFRIVSHEIFSIEVARVSQAKQFASHTCIIWCHKVSKYLVMWNYVPNFTTYLHATWLSWHRCSEFALIISVVSGSRNYFKLISVNLFKICAPSRKL